MGAITIRGLPEHVHNDLRQMAAAGNLSVEALVRNLLAAATTASQHVTGVAAKGELWGALQGCVQIPQATDLTAPTGEAWEAAN